MRAVEKNSRSREIINPNSMIGLLIKKVKDYGPGGKCGRNKEIIKSLLDAIKTFMYNP